MSGFEILMDWNFYIHFSSRKGLNLCHLHISQFLAMQKAKDCSDYSTGQWNITFQTADVDLYTHL